jgi:hypothetical protein
MNKSRLHEALFHQYDIDSLYSILIISMLCRWIFVVALALQAESLQVPLFAESCALSPLLAGSPPKQCHSGAKQRDRDAALAKAQSRPSRREESFEWDRPRHCLGKACVHANRGFGGGIVLVTTPDNADKVKAMKAPDSKGADYEPPFYAAEIPGKGIGLIASRPIAQGEGIMDHVPAILVHKDFVMNRETDYEQQARVLDLAIQKLPAPRRRVFMKLVGQDVADKLMTNTFQVDLGGDDGHGHHFGGYPEVSRLNHDCRPKFVST